MMGNKNHEKVLIINSVYNFQQQKNTYEARLICEQHFPKMCFEAQQAHGARPALYRPWKNTAEQQISHDLNIQ